MTSSNGNNALASAVRQACTTLGRQNPEVVVAVILQGGEYVLRSSSFPEIGKKDERRVPPGQVASGVADLARAKDVLVFVHGVNPIKNNTPQSWWSLFNPITEKEDQTGGGRVCYVPLITD